VCTTGELIALGASPNDATLGTARRLEVAKEKVRGATMAAPVDMYRDLLSAVREEFKQRIVDLAEEGERRVAAEKATADAVYQAGQKDATHAALSATLEAQTAFQTKGIGQDAISLATVAASRAMGGGASAKPLEALTAPARSGIRESLETFSWEVQRSVATQGALRDRIAQVQGELTRLHIRHNCSMELTKLKTDCRRAMEDPRFHQIVSPLGWQKFLLHTLFRAPYSPLLASILRARHSALAQKYSRSPFVGEGGQVGGVVHLPQPHYPLWAPPLAPTPPPPFDFSDTMPPAPPGYAQFAKAFGR